MSGKRRVASGKEEGAVGNLVLGSFVEFRVEKSYDTSYEWRVRVGGGNLRLATCNLRLA